VAHVLSGVGQVADEPSEARSNVIGRKSRERHESPSPSLRHLGSELVQKSIGVVNLSDQHGSASVTLLEFGISVALVSNAGNGANGFGFRSQDVRDDCSCAIRTGARSPIQHLGVAALDR
jgi:hypothetical protein